jgi:hypothetical protein
MTFIIEEHPRSDRENAMRSVLLATLVSLSLLGGPAPAADVASRDRSVLLKDLALFEVRFQAAGQEGLMTPGRARAVEAQTAALLAKYGLTLVPSGIGLSDGQLESLRTDFNALSGMLFRR